MSDMDLMGLSMEPGDEDKSVVVLCMGLTFPPTITVTGPFPRLEQALEWWARTKDFHDLEGSLHALATITEPKIPEFAGRPVPIDSSRN